MPLLQKDWHKTLSKLVTSVNSKRALIKRLNISDLDNVELLQKSSSKHKYPNHYHETFCVSLVKSGTLKENDLVLPTGAIVISHPFEVHNNELIEDIAYSFTTFYISPDVFRSISKSKHLAFEDKVIHDDKLFGEFDTLASRMMTISDSNEPIEKLSCMFFEGLKQLSRHHAINRPINRTANPELIEDVKRYILRRLERKISLNSLATKFGMSKYQFIRWFKKHVGLTPFDFIIINRIILGKKMISDGKPLLHTALDTGFYDQSHFSNYFKRFVGLTPKRYQKGCNIFQYSR